MKINILFFIFYIYIMNQYEKLEETIKTKQQIRKSAECKTVLSLMDADWTYSKAIVAVLKTTSMTREVLEKELENYI